MISIEPTGASFELQPEIRILRHAQICKKLNISSAKLFDMCAKGVFPKPFQLIPEGRAVGWLEQDVDAWILQRANGGE